MSQAIVLNDVRRSFGPKEVLRGVSASAEAGKVVGLLGRNGEGKTTLFEVMLDLCAADSGEVELLGRRPDGSGRIRQHVGYVPERPVFHDFMTAGEALALRERFFERWSASKARGLARALGLDLSTPINGASKGALAKLAWVCAASHDPELFLLDEPTSGLDALVRDDVLAGLVDELSASGKTILVANHHMEELAGVLDEVWVLSGGVISGVFDVERLRSEACRVAGRLKPGASAPRGLVALGGEGPIGEWAAFDRKSAEDLLGSGLLENAERSPLPLETTLKLLLKENLGGVHA